MGKLQSALVKDFTAIHNDFIKDERLGLEELGMLLKLMSLPDNWDFSIKGLAKIIGSGERKVSTALNNLIKYGYFHRIRQIDPKTGRIIDWIYEFSDQIHPEWFVEETEENEEAKESEPHFDNADVAYPHLVNEVQLNTNIINTNKSMIDGCGEAEFQEKKELVREQINEVNELIIDGYATEDEVEEIVDIITEVYVSSDKTIFINGNKMKMSRVQAQFSKLTSEHIAYFLQQLRQNKKPIVNMKKYIITGLYNSTMTMNNKILADVGRIMNNKRKKRGS